mmetsp:Transcript_15639/g.49246  ORF Transcript_15639/g.49246 Transcript_15639/m.49246 type:complete len:244 (-) Transcript_15639:109-840(-)
MRASPMAACAAFAERSVSSIECLTMSWSSPQEVIISEEMTVFSTISSAKLVLSTASGSSSSRILVSRSSKTLFFSSCSACWRAARKAVSWPEKFSWKPRILALSCWKAFVASPPAACSAPWAFRTTSARAPTCGASSFSASAMPAGAPSLETALACASALPASASTLLISFASSCSFPSACSFIKASLFLTTNEGRTCPSQGIFQPAPGGRRPLSLQCDQTWVPPSLLPNHQPSKPGPSRLSQ